MSVEDWKTCIERLCGMGVTALAFTGGEPLLKEGILDLLRFAAARVVTHVDSVGDDLVTREGPPRVHLLTNGRILTTEILDLCASLGIHLSMSLPGLSTFLWLPEGDPPQGILGRFAAAHARGISTTVAVTVTRRNLPELYETLAAGLLAGADSLLLNRFLPGGRGLAWAEDLLLAPEEILHMLDTAEEVLATSNRRGSVGTELPRCLLGDRSYARLEVGTRCSAVQGFFVVGPSGFVRVCNHSPVNLAHVREIAKVRMDPYWMRFVRKDFLPAACRGCRWMGACDGGCREAAHVTGGSLDAPDGCCVPAR